MGYDIIIGRDSSDKDVFGHRGLINLGKGYVKMGTYTSMSNNILMDIARSHVVLVAGKRGQGKSYSLGVIAEELSSLPPENAQNIASLIFDTMGIFWTMKYKNEKDKELLKQWNLETKSLPVQVFVPYGKIQDYKEKSIPFDKTFGLEASELEAEDWLTLFNLDTTSQLGVLIQNTITDLKRSSSYFTIQDIQRFIDKDSKSQQMIKDSGSALFKTADSWGIFSKEEKGTEISDLIKGGSTTILDVSVYSSIGAFNIRALVISLITRKLFKKRMDSRKKEELDALQHGADYLSYRSSRDPLVWIFIDECLTGDTEIITSKNHTSLQEVINKFQKGEKLTVLGFNRENHEFEHYPVTKVYKKGKRKIIRLVTETGAEIKCTPEHRVLTKQGFASGFSVNEIASPLIQHYSEDENCIKARIMGHLFGDGWATEKHKSLGFSGKKNKNDLELIKKDLSSLGLRSSNIFSRETRSEITNDQGNKIKVKGMSHSIHASFKAYKVFEPLGIIKGDKIIQKSTVPQWIKDSNIKVKVEFLAALMGSDGLKISKAKNAMGDFNAIRLSFNKLDILRKEAFEYAKEIKDLFGSIGIKISDVKERPGNIRKDGSKTIKIVITLEKNLENTVKFLEKIGYRYCKNKEFEGNKWLSYLKARLFLKKQREEIWEKSQRLHKEGLGKTKIAKKLGFPEAQIRDWIYNKIKPGLPKDFPDFDEWIKGREEGNILYQRIFRVEEVGEEEVYDISVDKAHNFVSNGLITHNCHEFLPREGKTPATDALIQLLREGRQPGISVVMATQQPGQIHRDVMSQSDIVISHRVTSKADLEALNEIMQSYVLQGIKQQMDDLPSLKGSAIILDDNSERIYPMRMRPRFTWHGGEAPTSVKADIKV